MSDGLLSRLSGYGDEIPGRIASNERRMPCQANGRKYDHGKPLSTMQPIPTSKRGGWSGFRLLTRPIAVTIYGL